MQSMNGAVGRVTLGLMLSVAVAACGDRTGVILEVTRDAETTPEQIDELRFYVGVAVAGSDPSSYVDDSASGEMVALDSGRDLLANPYRLLLTPDEVMDQQVMAVALGYGNGQIVGYARLDQPVSFMPGAVTQWPLILRGDPAGQVVVLETGCLILETDAGKIVIATASDRDCDGDSKGVDCNDLDPTVGPSKPEICSNQIDDDCDGETDEIEDADSDGVNNCEDCDDQNEHRYPGNLEVCDGFDNDCNAQCDGEFDGDDDGYTTCGTKVFDDGTCSDLSLELIDCDDEDPNSHPEADEVCDGADNDCNLECDDGFDPDNDLFTECGSRTDLCEGVLVRDIDCEPDEENAFPGNVPEQCDGLDNDCDGIFYEPVVPCYVKDTQGETTCRTGTRQCGDAQGLGWTTDCTADANSTVVPNELCTAYDACSAAPDPFACANQMVTATNYDCTISYPTAAPATVCKPAAVALPNTAGDGALCRWYMSPLSKRARYQATLTADLQLSGPDVNRINACAALFSVTGSLVVPPVEGGFLLVQNVNASSSMIRLHLHPVAVTECPSNGLSCTGLTSATTP